MKKIYLAMGNNNSWSVKIILGQFKDGSYN